MVDYEYGFQEELKLHLIRIDMESFNMSKGTHLRVDILRQIPILVEEEITFIFSTRDGVSHIGNEDGSISAETFSEEDLEDVEWDTYTYGHGIEADDDSEDTE